MTCDGENFETNAKDGKCVCKIGFALSDNQCIPCSGLIPGCTTCDDKDTCSLCDKDKDFDKDPVEGKCQCADTFYLNDKICAKCEKKISGCQSCNPNG